MGGGFAVSTSVDHCILQAVMQMLSFVMDYGMDLDATIHQPRIDASEGADHDRRSGYCRRRRTRPSARVSITKKPAAPEPCR